MAHNGNGTLKDVRDSFVAEVRRYFDFLYSLLDGKEEWKALAEPMQVTATPGTAQTAMVEALQALGDSPKSMADIWACVNGPAVGILSVVEALFDRRVMQLLEKLPVFDLKVANDHAAKAELAVAEGWYYTALKHRIDAVVCIDDLMGRLFAQSCEAFKGAPGLLRQFETQVAGFMAGLVQSGELTGLIVDGESFANMVGYAITDAEEGRETAENEPEIWALLNGIGARLYPFLKQDADRLLDQLKEKDPNEAAKIRRSLGFAEETFAGNDEYDPRPWVGFVKISRARHWAWQKLEEIRMADDAREREATRDYHLQRARLDIAVKQAKHLTAGEMRPVLDLAEQAEKAAEKGKFATACDLLAQGSVALREAKRQRVHGFAASSGNGIGLPMVEEEDAPAVVKAGVLRRQLTKGDAKPKSAGKPKTKRRGQQREAAFA